MSMNFVLDNTTVFLSVSDKLRNKIDKKIDKMVGFNPRLKTLTNTPSNTTSDIYNKTLIHLYTYEF